VHAQTLVGIDAVEAGTTIQAGATKTTSIYRNLSKVSFYDIVDCRCFCNDIVLSIALNILLNI